MPLLGQDQVGMIVIRILKPTLILMLVGGSIILVLSDLLVMEDLIDLVDLITLDISVLDLIISEGITILFSTVLL